MRKVLTIYGTRPEAIKLAPLIGAMYASEFVVPVVAVTGQHREMLDQVNDLFGIVPKHDLDIIRPRQTLTHITTRSLEGLAEVIEAEEPDAVLVQGDTTTAFAGALAGFYARVPVIHLEAGLRTANPYSPFPEEINRRLTTQVTRLHLAPTRTSRANLLNEGVRPEDVVISGNTVIDALHSAVAKRLPYDDPRLEVATDGGRRVVLVTAHRRESWGAPMAAVSQAIADLARKEPACSFVLPVHRNPVVRETLLPPLEGLDNVIILESMAYGQFARLIGDSYIILTDSGGLQEEGPSLGKPVLVMRDTTERPEAVEAGTAVLVGTDQVAITEWVHALLHDEALHLRMAKATNPYGDGRAAARGLRAIEHLFGAAERLPDFTPEI